MPSILPYILGFSDSVHDRAVCLFHGARPLVAIEEERLTRHKHGVDFAGLDPCDPAVFSKLALDSGAAATHQAQLQALVDYCLDAAGVARTQIGLWIGNSLHSAAPFSDQALFVNHHRAHAASTYFASGFDQAAVLVLDGYGDPMSADDFETVSVYAGDQSRLELRLRIEGRKRGLHLSNSLGILYRMGTLLSGFAIMDEGKMMGLAAYGNPRFLPLIQRHFSSSGAKLSFDNQAIWQTMSASAQSAHSFEQRADIAASFQAALEQIVLHYAAAARALTGARKLCLAGGVALNCVANQKILDSGLFEEVFVFPAAADNGIAFGAAYLGAHAVFGLPPSEALASLCWGRTYEREAAEQALAPWRAHLRISALDTVQMAERAAQAIVDQGVLMWFQDGSEFGPRALGHRSMLADPRRAEIKTLINRDIKSREAFRPLAPMVLEECCTDWFEAASSPFMLFSPLARTATQRQAPAIVHVDGSARLQTVSARHQAKIHRLLNCFKQLTGVPILLNTSLNIQGEPMVETPQDAVRAFMASPVQVLCLDKLYVEKSPASGECAA